MKRLLSLSRKAIEDYHMIAQGDKIAVGLSGGKDSTALLLALWQLKDFYPIKFDVVGITLEMGVPGFDFTATEKFVRGHGIPLEKIPTEIYEVIFNIRKEKNPCSLCANMRRGALNSAAKSLGCTKVALGHHFDDAVETFFMSLIYEGRLSCFSPVTYLSRQDITVIRPFVYVEEHLIRSAVKRCNIPIAHNPCPANGNTKRDYVKELVKTLSQEQRDLKQKIAGSLKRSEISGWGIK